MKFSYNWIREFVEDLNYAPGPLERLITMKTAECEGIEPVAELLAIGSTDSTLATRAFASSSATGSMPSHSAVFMVMSRSRGPGA